MKKFLFVLMGVFAVAGAFAAGENVPTSKSYVDAAVATKQDKISANDGATRVLTNTGTAGEYGTKGIYDATGAYATQTQNLVDAATMNAGVQNAINSEFQCIEWDDHGDCLLFNIFGETGKSVLPTGFTALEYLESTGTQYIDTRVTLGVDFEIYLDAMLSGRADHILLAGNLDVQKYSASLFASGINGMWGYGGIGFGGDNNRFYIGISPFWVMHYNGVKYVVVRGYSPSGTLKVFSGTVGRLYNLKIYSGPLLQFNGIPARRDSDGKIGMYDTVTNTFFTNSGTGEFIAGPVVNLYLPSGN